MSLRLQTFKRFAAFLYLIVFYEKREIEFIINLDTVYNKRCKNLLETLTEI